MSTTADAQSDNKMQFVSTNYSDLEGDLGKPARIGAATTATTTTKPASGGFSSPASATAMPASTSIPMYSTGNERISTLDEPVSVTISRDLKAVGYKFGHVFFPKQSTLLLRDWDLWVMCF